jgi:hypothetical protein
MRRAPICSRPADVTSIPWSAVSVDVASAALAEQTGALPGEVAPRANRSLTILFHVEGSCKPKRSAVLNTLQRVQRFMATNAEP